MINFTKENKERLVNLTFDAVDKRWQVVGNIGQEVDVMDLFHTTTITTLRNLKKRLTEKLNNLPDDEWTDKSTQDEEKVKYLQDSIELINLTIGYRLWKEEQHELESKKAELELKLAILKEDAKTPQERIKELEEELAKF